MPPKKAKLPHQPILTKNISQACHSVLQAGRPDHQAGNTLARFNSVFTASAYNIVEKCVHDLKLEQTGFAGHDDYQ